MKVFTVIKRICITGVVIYLTSFCGCNQKITKKQENQAIISAIALNDIIGKHPSNDHDEFVTMHPVFSESMHTVFIEKFSSLDAETILYKPEIEDNTLQLPGNGRHWNIIYKQCSKHKDCFELTIILYDPCQGVHDGYHHYESHYQNIDGEWVCVSYK